MLIYISIHILSHTDYCFIKHLQKLIPAEMVGTQHSTRSTHRGACPEGTRVPNRGRVAEGQSSEGQRHHGAAEQQLQQSEREQRPPGQQQSWSAPGDPGRGGQAARSVSVRRLHELRSPGNRTARPRQHHWERHLDGLQENPKICRALRGEGVFSGTAGWIHAELRRARSSCHDGGSFK